MVKNTSKWRTHIPSIQATSRILPKTFSDVPTTIKHERGGRLRLPQNSNDDHKQVRIPVLSFFKYILSFILGFFIDIKNFDVSSPFLSPCTILVDNSAKGLNGLDTVFGD
jgi:hypothetical protein